MTQPQTVWAVEGADLPEGPFDLMKIGHEDGGVTRLAKWPEGLVLWHEGEIVWKQWEAAEHRRPKIVTVSCHGC